MQNANTVAQAIIAQAQANGQQYTVAQQQAIVAAVQAMLAAGAVINEQDQLRFGNGLLPNGYATYYPAHCRAIVAAVKHNAA